LEETKEEIKVEEQARSNTQSSDENKTSFLIAKSH